MRYAIVSDIHANLQAWEAVLRDSASNRIDGIICLGDVVGYGPNPAEVLRLVHSHVDALALGNHDAALCGKLDPVLFNDQARHSIEWTRTALAPQAVEVLSTWPLVLVGEGFRCAHGDFAEPGAFNYMIDPYEALPSWQATTEPLLFAGHTHLPGIFVLGEDGIPKFIEAQDFISESGTRYLVNVGSVGFSREHDPRAVYCIYDSSEKTVCWRRIPFDIDGYRRALTNAGFLNTNTNFFLADPLTALQPIRGQLDFAPATRAELQVQNVIGEQELARTLRRGLVRWKILAGALLALVLTIVTGLALCTPLPKLGVSCPTVALAPRRVHMAATDASQPNLLPAIPAASTGAGRPIEGWRYALDDRTRQSVAVSNATLRAASLLPAGHIRIEAAPVELEDMATRRLCMSSRIRTSADFSGSLELVVDLLCLDSAGKRIPHPRREQKDFRQTADGKASAKKTFDLPKDARYVTLAIEGAFSGTAEITEINLTPVSKR